MPHNGSYARNLSGSSCGEGLTGVLHGRLQRHHRIIVFAIAEASFGEDAVAGDPREGLGMGVLCVGLEQEPLAGTPAARVDQRMGALGEFVPVIVRLTVGAQVEVALRTAQRAGIFAQILEVGQPMDHRCDHEGRVDDFYGSRAAGRSKWCR
jgi:hypothetical protein